MANFNDTLEMQGELSKDSSSIFFPHFRIYQRYLKKFAGQELMVKIEILRHKRSDKQNRYMWAVIVPYVQHWLHETEGKRYKRDHVYSWIRISLLEEEPVIVTIQGKEMIEMTGKRFSQMSTKEFGEAVDTIREKMLERGVDIPEPTTDKRKHNFPHEFLEDE